jgi:hypothetical protein
MDILDYGHWEGERFFFNVPLIIQGNIVESIDFRHLILPSGEDIPSRQEFMVTTVEEFLQPDLEERISEVPPEDDPTYGGPAPHMN